MNYMLLKFISNEKFLNDFLNGSLYMNTIYYYWNQYSMDKAREKRDKDLQNNLNLDPHNYGVPIEGGPGPGVMDLFEGTVSSENPVESNAPDFFKLHAKSDFVYRSVGMGYCNLLCFSKVDWELIAGKYKCDYVNMQEFGDYVVIVDDLNELVERIHKAVRGCGFKYSCGPVRYRNLTKNENDFLADPHLIIIEEDNLHEIKNMKLRRDAFFKMEKYKYQREWRVALYRGVKEKAVYRLEVGNLRDIVHWVKRENLEVEIKRILKKHDFKQPASLWYGDDRRELRDLFYALGDYKAERLRLFG